MNHTCINTGTTITGAPPPPCAACLMDAKHFVDSNPGERALVQLAGCSVAALGCAVGEQAATKGSYGWSPAYEDVLKLRRAFEKIAGGRSPDEVLASDA